MATPPGTGKKDLPKDRPPLVEQALGGMRDFVGSPAGGFVQAGLFDKLLGGGAESTFGEIVVDIGVEGVVALPDPKLGQVRMRWTGEVQGRRGGLRGGGLRRHVIAMTLAPGLGGKSGEPEVLGMDRLGMNAGGRDTRLSHAESRGGRSSGVVDVDRGRSAICGMSPKLGVRSGCEYPDDWLVPRVCYTKTAVAEREKPGPGSEHFLNVNDARGRPNRAMWISLKNVFLQLIDKVHVLYFKHCNMWSEHGQRQASGSINTSSFRGSPRDCTHSL